ncbi:Major Facilitator Superfamily (MFS) [Phytophthora palmivora]|uniref:Major Facilitator Superfamily (MFS) n=1 Tax=Phytophthora palmivora TaxID=4796 RepID=A0A2P4XGD9_9STRA|nr:Major Facilitator Superfamily (MFS) [Phytophthora palmivora]
MRSTAEYLVNHGHVEDLRRGGAQNIMVTPALMKVLEGYLHECCSYTLRTLQKFILMDFNVNLSTPTILCDLLYMLYTVKQDPARLHTRSEPTTCNNETNNDKRKKFAEALVKYHRLGKKTVFVFDNAPAHIQTETLVTTRDDHSRIKEYLALTRPEVNQAPTARTAIVSLILMTEARMRLLERDAHGSMPTFTQPLVVTMALHTRDFVNVAILYEDMSYGV